MIKTEITADLRRFLNGGSFLRRVDLAHYMNRKDAHSVDRYLRGLQSVDGLYYVGDVAEVILNEQKANEKKARF